MCCQKCAAKMTLTGRDVPYHTVPYNISTISNMIIKKLASWFISNRTCWCNIVILLRTGTKSTAENNGNIATSSTVEELEKGSDLSTLEDVQ